jgi:ribosomal protein L14E/L6E/L27E
MKPGDLVISSKGRYDGQYFFVIDVKDGFAELADGKKRSFSHPKRKKLSHLSETNLFSEEVVRRIEDGANAIDALMRAELKRLKNMLQ